MDNKVRLNAQKRQALKKEWANTVYNKTPMQVDDNGNHEGYRTATGITNIQAKQAWLDSGVSVQ